MTLLIRKRKAITFLGILCSFFFSYSHAQSGYLYDKESNFFYDVFNDAQSIIVSIKVGDPMQQMKLVRNGGEIWVDYKGKTSKRTGIKFPLPSSGGFSQQGGMPNQRNTGNETPSMRPMIEFMMETKKEIELIGFKEEINGKFDINNTTGVRIEMGFSENDTLIYICSIPFSGFAQNLDFEKLFSVGIIIKGMERPEGVPGGFPGVGALPGGMMPPSGGMGGGRMRGGAGMPDMREMEKMFSDNIIWHKLKFKL